MKSLQTVQSLLVCGLVFLLPLFFLPVTSDFFNINKLALLVVLTLGALFVWGAKNLKSSHFSFYANSLNLPVFLFALAAVVSGFLSSQNKLNSFIFPGVATYIVFSVLFYFALVNYLESEQKGVGPLSRIVDFWVFGVTAAAGVMLASWVGAFSYASHYVDLPSWLTNSRNFSTLGGLVPAIYLFVISLPLVFGKVMQALGRAEGGKMGSLTLVYLGSFVIFVAGLVMAIYSVLPGKAGPPATLGVALRAGGLVNLPLSSGWSIALEVLKKPQTFLFGVGPGNFIEAFARFRPVEYNTSSSWNLSFSASTNWYLEILTTLGAVGLGIFIFLLVRLRAVIAKVGSAGDIPYVKAAMVVSLVAFLLYPANMLVVFAFFCLLGMLAAFASRSTRVALFSVIGERTTFEGAGAINLVALGLTTLAVVGLAAVGIFGSKIYAADVSYRNALNVVAKQGKYKDVMDNLASAITLNTQADFYRIDYSQVSLALMQQIASKKDLTDADKNDISALVQLSIAQGKAAVSLNPNRVGNWANLAGIYRVLIPIVQGADQFTVQVYQQAISLEPTNPNLRIALGGVLYSLKNYDEAARAFELAVASKPDLANAHYNLAVVLRDSGKIERAAAEMQQTLALLKPGTSDYDTAKKELDMLQAKVKERAQEATASASPSTRSGQEQPPLSAPQPVPSPVVTPKFEVPGSNPPSTGGGAPTAGQGPATPTPTPTR